MPGSCAGGVRARPARRGAGAGRRGHRRGHDPPAVRQPGASGKEPDPRRRRRPGPDRVRCCASGSGVSAAPPHTGGPPPARDRSDHGGPRRAGAARRVRRRRRHARTARAQSGDRRQRDRRGGGRVGGVERHERRVRQRRHRAADQRVRRWTPRASPRAKAPTPRSSSSRPTTTAAQRLAGLLDPLAADAFVADARNNLGNVARRARRHRGAGGTGRPGPLHRRSPHAGRRGVRDQARDVGQPHGLDAPHGLGVPRFAADARCAARRRLRPGLRTRPTRSHVGVGQPPRPAPLRQLGGAGRRLVRPRGGPAAHARAHRRGNAGARHQKLERSRRLADRGDVPLLPGHQRRPPGVRHADELQRRRLGAAGRRAASTPCSASWARAATSATAPTCSSRATPSRSSRRSRSSRTSEAGGGFCTTGCAPRPGGSRCVCRPARMPWATRPCGR